MKKRKKICFILPTLHAGGIENYTLRFARYAKGRFELTIVCLHTQRGDLHDLFADLNIRVVYKRIGYFSPFGFMRLYRFFKANTFDGLVDFTGNFAGTRMAIGKWSGIKRRIAFYRRSNNAFQGGVLKNTYNRWVNRLVYRYATGIFSNSQYALQFFFPYRQTADNRFKVICNGVDAKLFDPKRIKDNIRSQMGIPANAFVVGHIGRYDPAKNHETMLKVAHTVLSHYDDVVFIFCGKGTDGPVFRNKINALGGVQKRICALGLHRDVPTVLNAMDVFYFPSLNEGQPNALIEAMLMDLPIIAADIDPIREVMPPERHSSLIQPMDVKGAIRALQEIKRKQGKAYQGYRQWAMQHFDQAQNFKQLENEL